MVQNLSQSVEVQYSNQVWCLSFSSLDVVVEDENSAMIGRPLLTTLCDVHSSVVSGYYFGLGEPSQHMAVAALRHAMLRKHYPLEGGLMGDWAVYGVPEILMVDASTLWTASNFAPLPHLLEKLDITLVRRTAPSAGTIIERFVEGFSSRIESLPLKSTGRSAAVEGGPRLTLAQLDRLLLQYIVNEYNQSLHPRARTQTRLERWQSGLASSPQVLLEQDFEV
jgi:putative transposase